ncbi:MAG TPA: triple tyrosine motif-containing protein, partial [Steroidobacteraceae bacterium]|nr:triple tyrosine motif-containing protein [Steroidobacteraceae bacterium]
LGDLRGGLWLYASCGIVHIAPDQVRAWWSDPQATLEFRVYDALDGAQPARGNFHPNASTGPDGRLWFSNASVVQVIDPDRLRGNTLAPPVHIEQLVADRNVYPVQAGLRLPPLTRDLQIDYTGLSMVIPRKTQFRYRLDGHDSEWQEAGARRQAFYTDLPPGDYRFHVTASNNDGVWNETGTSLAFSVTPTFYQTRWFAVLCLLVAALLLWLIYAARVRQLTLREQARFEERLAERTRLARELHDTLLQTIQGSKLVAEHALDAPSDSARLRRAMEQLSAWLGQAVKEGREALRALRGPAEGLDDLAAALKRAAESTQIDGSMQIVCATSGQPRELHPIVADEVYRIGYEAIRNACMHSGASKLDIEVAYDGDFTLRVSDNGKGIADEVSARGKEGHFGLRGMRERAAHIGAGLTVRKPAVGNGTRVELIVPERSLSRK